MKRGAIVVYESTVYPGATEEDCVPVLERGIGPTSSSDFFVGYSPGAHQSGRQGTHARRNHQGRRRLDTPETLEQVDRLYGCDHRRPASTRAPAASSVAEAAKVIENTQRDLNIALMNELAIIFNRMGIDTHEVLEAAGTKWNFLPFRPGLVGGHCIGVDPYYLTHKAETLGYHPAGHPRRPAHQRRHGPAYVAEQTVKQMICHGAAGQRRRRHLLGMTFKENCPDMRNSKVIDVVRELQSYGCQVHVHDPIADLEECQHEYGLNLTPWNELPQASAIIAAVVHKEYAEERVEKLLEKLVVGGVFTDVKSAFDPEVICAAGAHLWRL